ncbi:hypothetical protein [Streptomyces achromogenes]|uniref:hypothetical protein n=1 Tax=Streptomyces achromogenes TaxID=67255 RepID=UPI0036C2EBB1
MPLTHHSLIDGVAARFGWRPVYATTTKVDALLTEQSEAAYRQTADHTALATAKYTNTLSVQPGVLDVRGRIFADVLYLEGVLAGARTRGLAPELIQRLEDGHELTVLPADTVRATATAHSSGD